ncbi:MAG: NADPH-dependent FMN [Geobacteraceae bacterium]|nr:MAG: NADPH-dependent FMN [Geobacteraceae bacterium]
MKIVCLLGSPRSEGNSATIARRFLETAESLGAESRTFELNRLTYRGCQGCYACKASLDHCVLEDDLTEVLQAIKDADVVVYASPVYYGDITAQLKGFMDRTFSYLVPDFETNPQPSRLSPGKKLLFILTQGHPDAAMFADIFPRYDYFLKWGGFVETRLIRACGVGAGGVRDVPEGVLRESEETARAFLTP